MHPHQLGDGRSICAARSVQARVYTHLFAALCSPAARIWRIHHLQREQELEWAGGTQRNPISSNSAPIDAPLGEPARLAPLTNAHEKRCDSPHPSAQTRTPPVDLQSLWLSAAGLAQRGHREARHKPRGSPRPTSRRLGLPRALKIPTQSEPSTT